MARTAAKRRAKMQPPGKVVVHPIALRYHFQGDINAAANVVLDDIESRLTWRKQKDLSLQDRIHKTGSALLALKEIEYLGHPQTGDIGPRLQLLIDAILNPLEDEWLKGRQTDSTPTRVKRIRTAILPDLATGELPESERMRRWKQLADVYLAQQLFHYPADYLGDNSTPDRILETIERFEEDITDRITVHGEMHATITVGDAIEVPPARESARGHRPAFAADRIAMAKNAWFGLGRMIILIRIVTIAVSLALWFWTQRFLARRPAPALPESAAIPDGIHRLTARFNRDLFNNPRRANALLIASSLGIDILGLYLLISAIFGPTFQPFLGLLTLFILRQFCQAFCPLPPPPGMIWRYPGFPTLLVTYGTPNDLFFSGHTAIAVYGATILATNFGHIGLAAGLAIAIFEIAAVLLLRAHYTMDVFTGAITALYVHVLAQMEPHSRSVDRPCGFTILALESNFADAADAACTGPADA